MTNIQSKQAESTKKWWASKTNWFNLCVLFLLLLERLIPAMSNILPENIYELIITIVPAINIYLRSITNKGIEPILGGR